MNITIRYARSSGQRSVKVLEELTILVDAFFGYGSKFLNTPNLSWGPFGTLILTYCHVGMARNSSQRLDKKHMEGADPRALYSLKNSGWHVLVSGHVALEASRLVPSSLLWSACGKRWANAESGLTLEARIWRIGWGNFWEKDSKGFY